LGIVENNYLIYITLKYKKEMKKQMCTAIICTKNNQFLKYRNIPNHNILSTNFYNPKFIEFAKTMDAGTINIYDKLTKQFLEQIKF
jgi:hypothetical protein